MLKPKNTRFASTVAVYTFLLAIQLVAWGQVLLFPDGRWWDDWILTSIPSGQYQEIFQQQGAPLFSITYGQMGNWPLWTITVIGIICWYVASISFSKIIGRLTKIAHFEMLILAATCLTIPLVDARVLKCMTPFLICVALYFLGWLIFTNTNTNKYLIVTKPILVTLFISAGFSTASTISFTLVLVLLFISFEKTKNNKLFLIKDFWIRLIPVTVAPASIYLALKFLYPQVGKYEDYNRLGNINLKTSLLLIFILVLLIITVAFFLRLISTKENKDPLKSSDLAFGVLGFIALLAAVLPYVVVGKIPISFTGFDSRFQLLVPFGASLFVVYIFGKLRTVRPRSSYVLLGILFIVFISVSNIQIFRYRVDYLKQESIIQFIQTNSDKFQSSSLLLITDLSSNSNVNGHDKYNYYEVSAWLSVALQNHRNLGFSYTESYYDQALSMIAEDELWKLGARDFEKPFTVIQVYVENLDISKIEQIRLVFENKSISKVYF